jgi:hypothetical protein
VLDMHKILLQGLIFVNFFLSIWDILILKMTSSTVAVLCFLSIWKILEIDSGTWSWITFDTLYFRPFLYNFLLNTLHFLVNKGPWYWDNQSVLPFFSSPSVSLVTEFIACQMKELIFYQQESNFFYSVFSLLINN